MTQYGSLIRLHKGGGCGVSEIAAHVGVTNAAASQMIDRLVQMGLLARVEDPADRRGKQISLTPAGMALVQESFAVRHRWTDGLAEILNPEERASIAEGLSRLVKAAYELNPVSAPLESSAPPCKPDL